MTDAMTGQSRGYGFVRFGEESDQQRALVEMQGVYCGNRPMRISTATPKTRYVGPPGQALPIPNILAVRISTDTDRSPVRCLLRSLSRTPDPCGTLLLPHSSTTSLARSTTWDSR